MTSTTAARIGVVDDHPSVVLGVSAIVNAQPDLRVVGAAATATDLVHPELRFDLVLLDLRLGDGSSVTDNVLSLSGGGTVVVAFTSGEHAELVREAARAGIAGLIRKSESPERIVGFIRAALRGEIIATPEWAAALGEDRTFVDASLTARESEVLSRYASGQTADQVGRALFVSRDTVLDHLRRIRRRYAAVGRDAPTKLDLHRRAVEDGLLPH